MKLKVLLFGISTDLVGANSLDIEFSENKSVLELKKTLQDKFPQMSELNSYAIAVNESYANDHTQLKENDVVAIIPPVSGG
ncbi:MoaD/ThiS family protein [Pseudotenacibaculum sp. MALMAid0570]|uniref:MoaD/ThiS family protein n=1 Tax=Pseudotenacibaculum sp. MALMAid0570 TaxID=3143938 RepID=UPI0032DEDBAE